MRGELGSLYFSWAIWSVIFCFPVRGRLACDGSCWKGLWRRTVSAGLHRSFYIPNTLHGDAVLVVSVDVLVLELTNLVQQNAQFVRDVGDILVAGLAPDRQLLLWKVLATARGGGMWECAKRTATSIRSLATSSRLRMTFFSILTSCDSFFAKSGPKAPAVFRRRACPSPPVNHPNNECRAQRDVEPHW